MPRYRFVVAVVVLSSSPFALAEAPAKQPAPAAVEAKCEHGVAKALCARCNPKLEPVFKKKGDWCAEHARPESQCALCSPELAKKGVK